jgi:hypothetical protein
MEHNHHTGSTYWRYFDGQRWIFRTDHDAEQIINGNKAAQAEFAAKKRQEGLGDPVASVPLNVYFDKLAEPMRNRDTAFVRRWLNDSENRDWRMRDGRL